MIQDDAEIKRIVESYSSINAATCQQSMDIRKGAIDKKYDLVIIDEAARANPLDLMIPMVMGKKVILVGDHKQLPHMLSPEVVKEYRKEGNTEQMQVLEESLFERLFNTLEASGAKKRTTRLTKQYRMNPIISNFASKCFYEEKNTDVGLDSSEVKVEEKQANLGMYKDKPLVFLDLPQEIFDAEKSGVSKSRPAEAKVIMDEVVKVLKKDPNKSIGIITFYRKQVDVINEYKINLTDEQKTRVEIGTVDAFQGKEFDVVFLSCVRANNYSEDDLHKKIGHSRDKNRLCVSYTRARQLLVTVGDKETMSFIPEMKELIEICEKGDVGYYELIK
jgi:superfamily I DNA and/or RNA helicase